MPVQLRPIIAAQPALESPQTAVLLRFAREKNCYSINFPNVCKQALYQQLMYQLIWVQGSQEQEVKFQDPIF